MHTNNQLDQMVAIERTRANLRLFAFICAISSVLCGVYSLAPLPPDAQQDAAHFPHTTTTRR